MNQKIRQFLIDQSILGQPIYYEDVANQIGLNLALDRDRNVLSKTLGEISAYEHKNGRPLISAMAIYKTANDHGNGFYNLCEELGIGKANQLKKEFYGLAEIENCKSFWKNRLHYDQFYNLKRPTYKENENPFFNIDEIDFFGRWADKVYDKSNKDNVTAKDHLLNTVWKKTKFWSTEVVERLEYYETSNKMIWSKRGWADGKRVANFKPYTWARIFKKGNKEKDIFFTVGVDPSKQALVYKLDFYQENDSNLSKKQKELCLQYIPKSLKWNEIPAQELSGWDWESLIKKTVDFISKNSHHYDQLLLLVWGKVPIEKVFRNNLTLRDFPEGGFFKLPPIDPSFNGITIDFEKKNKENKELGDMGEELVLEYERKKLKEKGLNDLLDKVKIVKDGMGYDIRSFDENGNTIYIEVKTTKGEANTPFYLSLNEKLFFEKNKATYLVYRLYNYETETNYADFFILKNLTEQLLFQPTQFKVYLRKKSKDGQ